MTTQRRSIQIAPSIMCADFLNLERELKTFESGGIPLLHVDIMDGHYVPNFTLGPDFCAKLVQGSSIPLDIHLMIEDVDAYVPLFASFGTPLLCFHPEVSYHPLRTISLIRGHGAKPGIAIDPATPLENLKYLLPEVDFVCVMTVNPGYAGQKLIPSALKKIEELRRHLDGEGLPALIEVDGNVSWANIPAMIAAGADILVAGTSSLFSPEAGREENLARLRGMVSGFPDET